MTMRPQVVAHRGASHDTAEHTLGAYVKALDQGAEALECDVRLTADGHLVCVHDRDLLRTASTRGLVSTMELAELDQLDFASWKNPWADLDDEAQDLDLELGRVLTLRKLLEVVADYDRSVELAIETKHPTRYAGLVERRLAEALAAFGWDGAGAPVRVMSFSYTALQRMRRLAPGVPLVMLIDKKRHWAALQPVVGDDWILGPGIDLLRDTPVFAQRLAATGRDIHVWTVNTEADLDVCLRYGVKAVITDRPGMILGLLDDRTLEQPG
ncbi:glycerophosphodiester phosphodiesterase family protein [Nocardioides bigeumensis]